MLVDPTSQKLAPSYLQEGLAIEAYPIFDVPYVPDEKSNEQKAYEISKHFLKAHLCTSSFLEGIKIDKFAFDL